MKLYIKTPVPIIRVSIKKQGEKTEYINLCETTQVKVYKFIEELIKKENISPFQKGYTTNIEIREALGGKNLKSISLSFKGLATLTTKMIILDELQNDYIQA